MTIVGRVRPLRRVLVVGIGNPDRGDDAVGPAVVQVLAERLPDDVLMRTRSGNMLALIDDWAGFDAVVCIDAAAPMGAPGRIHRIDATTDTLPRDMSCTSSHAFGLAETIALARTLSRAPRDIVVFAVEGRSFDGGAGMTADVAAAVDPAADRVVAEVERLRRHDALDPTIDVHQADSAISL